MSLYDALFSQEQLKINSLERPHSVSANRVKTINNVTIKLGLTTLIATAVYLPNLSRAANAADLNRQTQVVRGESKYPAFLPRILSLIPAPLKNTLANLSGVAQATPIPSIFSSVPVKQNLDNTYFDLTATANQAKFGINSEGKLSALSTAPTPAAAQPKYETYKVQLGDTAYGIARKHQVSLAELIKLNNLSDSDLVVVNRQLIIPSQKLKSTVSKTNLSQTRALVAEDITNLQSRPKLQLASADLSTRVLKSNSSQQPKSVEDDPYIAKLRAEIEQMRAEHRHQLKEKKRRNVSNSGLSLIDAEDSNYLSLSQPSQDRHNSDSNVATSSPTTKTIKSNLFAEDNVALKLPPLPPSEEYLPSAFDGYTWPAKGVLTSGYGWRWGRLHGGIDIAAPIGTPIFAAASGEVITAGWNSGGYGNLVKLKHLDGSITVYAHNNRILVNRGQRVNQGDLIAEMGSTGYSTGSHLHFEIHPPSRGAVNPLALLNR